MTRIRLDPLFVMQASPKGQAVSPLKELDWVSEFQSMGLAGSGRTADLAQMLLSGWLYLVKIDRKTW